MKRAISRDLRFRLFVLMQAAWSSMLIILTLWWGTLLIQQSKEMAALKEALGQPQAETQSHVEKMERMIFFESGTFILLLLVTNGILIYLFNRDHQRSKSVHTFFASLTHELKTPLTSIRLQAEALQDIEDDPRHTPYVNRLLEDVARLEGQLTQSLELARLEGGGKLQSASVSLSQVIQKFLKQNSLVQSGKVKLESTSSVPAYFIRADISALNIIFRNTLDNASRYSLQSPAEVKLVVSKLESTIEISLEHANSTNQDLATLSGELFARGPQSQGAGVGLYLIKTLMNQMDGRAQFQAEPNSFKTILTFQISEEDHV